MISALSKVSKVDEIHIDSLTSAGVYFKKSIYMDPIKHFWGRIWEALLRWEKTFGGEERLFSVESCGNPWLPVAQNGIPEESEFSLLDTYQKDIFRDSKALDRCSFNGWSTSYIFITPTHDILFFLQISIRGS